MAPCSWTLPTCGCGGGCLADLAPEARTRVSAMASLIVWALTGRRYGLCEITVQPCNPTPAGSDYAVYPVTGYGGAGTTGYPYIDGGQWYNRGAGCGSCCTSGCEVALPGPVASITEVTVAGVDVDPAAYQIHDRHLLVRVDGACWPGCVNYANTPADFTVTYRRGEAVPSAVTEAAASLACELAKACTGALCRLPSRVVSMSRQGVDVQFDDLSALFTAGLTGLDEVDRVITAVNPGRLNSRPAVWSPDVPTVRMVT